MNLVASAMRRPMTMVVAIIAVALGAWVALQRMSRDVFPPLGIPTIYVAQPFGGMDPAQMEGYLTYYYEYHFLYITGIEHVESKSIQGASLMKLQFHPGTDMSAAMSETVAYVNRARAFMPPGTPGPFITRFDAGSVPVGYLVFSTTNANRTVGEMQNAALNMVRPLFATLPGVSAPPPFGGAAHTILINVKPDRLRAYGLSADEVVNAIASANVLSPSGNLPIRDKFPFVPVNAVVKNPQDLAAVPIRTSANGSVFVRDLADVVDGADTITSYALVNGRRTVFMPVTKRADASTISVVGLVKKNIPEFKKVLPEDIDVTYEMDQSPIVTRSINDLVKEGAIGAVLTGLMVLLFLRDWRSAFIVVINIPLSLLAAVFALWLSGQNINLMTLGGLALAVGILVDEATVAVENIHAHLARGASPARAALDATRETALPRLLAMLCVLAVFIPAFFMQGAAKALFVPLALAVGFSMIASFVLSSTLVPILSVWFLRGAQAAGLHDAAVRHPAPTSDATATGKLEVEEGAGPAPSARGPRALPGETGFARFANAYAAMLRPIVAARWALVLVYLVASLGIVWFVGRKLGTEIFPKVDAGQIQIRLRAAPGTHLDRTEAVALRVLELIKREAGADNVLISIGLVGVHAQTYPINLIYQWNAGTQEGVLQVQFKRGTVRVEPLKEKLRAVFKSELPGVEFSFEPSDIVERVMSFGAQTPIEVAVQGQSLAVSREFAEKLRERLAEIPALRDLQYGQVLDYPTVDVNINRERAGLMGVKMSDATRALVPSTASSRLTVPNYWADPVSGIAYAVQVQVPQGRVNSVEEFRNTPITSAGGKVTSLRNIATVSEGTAPQTYERYNLARVVSLTANLHGSDLGAVTKEIRRALDDVGAPPAKTSVAVRGQAVPLTQLLDGFRSGLIIAIVVIFLMLAANFQSLRLSLAVVSTVPAVLAGVVLVLWVTRTTLNIQSAMGAIMAIGVAVANAILLVTFAERGRVGSAAAPAASVGASPTGSGPGQDVFGEGAEHDTRGRVCSPVDAAVEGARSRLRPILMTSCAMIAGMIPLALGLGEGGDQTAPLGRAVVGGLALATLATLFVLPGVFAILAGGKVRSPSLDPEDPASAHFESESAARLR